MKERRYFYTDDLAAAWMAKHFGMTITAETPFHVAHYHASQQLGNELHLMQDFIRSDTDGPWYVHPDSLHLLKPQYGDLLYWQHDGFVHTDSTGGREPQRVSGFGIHPVHRGDVIHGGSYPCWVIQRNGIPFHMPESTESPAA